MRRLTRVESHAQTRQKLIAAAREEIADKGVAAASVRSISEAAGYSQGAFYSCFDGKEALLLHLLGEAHESLLRRFTAVPERIEGKLKETKAAAIVELVVAEMDAYFASTNPGTAYASMASELQIYANHKVGQVKGYERERADFHAALGQVMSRVFDYLPNRPAIEPAHLAMSLLATGVGFMTMGASISLEERRRILSALFRGAIGFKTRR